MSRLFAGLEFLNAGQQEFAHGDDGFVAYAEMFLAAIEYRPHALGGAAIVIEKIFDAGEVHRPLHLAVLEIIVARVADARVVGIDLFAPVHLVVLYRAVAAKADVVAPAMGIVGRHIGVDFVAFVMPVYGCVPAGITKAEKRT